MEIDVSVNPPPVAVSVQSAAGPGAVVDATAPSGAAAGIVASGP